MVTPRILYQQSLQNHQLISDPVQVVVIDKLQHLYDELLLRQKKNNFFYRLFRCGHKAAKGVYIWGDVGRGKTCLVDMFYKCLPFKNKIRLHYHRFMQQIHADLKRFKGEKDPLSYVAKQFAKRTCIIVLDEFFVNDIADAMILSRLLIFLFSQGITLVTTSNIHPDNLYHDGLHRTRFLPAIDLIKGNMDVVNLNGATDYRLRTLEQAPVYYFPVNAYAVQQMKYSFTQLSGGSHIENSPNLEVEDRIIPAVYLTHGMVWFRFNALCDGPRSQNDYIALACEYHTVFLEGVYVMTADNEDIMRRFIALVDAFYDNSVNLIIAAEVPADKIYQGEKLQFEFRRTLSRLKEMQSTEYLGKTHQPCVTAVS